MPTAIHTSAFLPDDPPVLVDAALACPACLGGEIAWRLGGDVYDARVECECRACGFVRTLHVKPEQALRLSLHAGCPPDPTESPRDLSLAL